MKGYYWELKVQPGHKYDPSQPRVPAGDPRGGQWAAVGGMSGPTVSPLPKTFKNASVARWYLDIEAFPKKNGKAITGLSSLSDEQVIEVAETVKDLLDKAPYPSNMVKELEIGDNCAFLPYERKIVIDPKYGEGRLLKAVKEDIEDDLKWAEPGGDYHRQLLVQKAAIDSGDYKNLHSIYWYGEGRALEAIIRHEWGHAWHNVYDRSRKYGIDGIDSLRTKGWEDKYAITERSRQAWEECVAENFAAWTTGNRDLMNPEMVRLFDEIAGSW